MHNPEAAEEEPEEEESRSLRAFKTVSEVLPRMVSKTASAMMPKTTLNIATETVSEDPPYVPKRALRPLSRKSFSEKLPIIPFHSQESDC